MTYDEIDLAMLLRAAADDELNEEQRERLGAHLAAHPEDEARIEFECRLREATARVMSQVVTPPGLRARIEAGLAERPEVRRFRIPRSILAAAASIVVIVGVLVALMSPTSPIGPEARHRMTVVGYLDREHKRCWIDAKEILGKFTIRDRAALPEGVAGILERPISLAEVEHAELSGLRFVAAGKCNVPGQDPSVHVGFETVDGAVPVSLFMQAESGQWGLDEGVTYALTNERRIARGVCTIYVWKREGILHFLVADELRACDELREALGAPATIRQL